MKIAKGFFAMCIEYIDWRSLEINTDLRGHFARNQ
jgi:hypothetical protein